MYIGKIETPIGTVFAKIDDGKIQSLSFTESPLSEDEAPETFCELKKQLNEYFSGNRTVFDLPLDPGGTPFQKKVLQAMIQVPYGTTISYSELAALAGNPKAIRAAASVCPKNPIFIIIPCHRIIRKDGSIGKYASGSKVKKWLLRHERNNLKDNLNG